MIEYLELSGFRNFSRRVFDFSASDILLTGPNGSGKSGVLEALGFLSILRSFRNAKSREMIRIGDHFFELKCRLRQKNLPVILKIRENSEGSRQLWIGGANPHRSSDFIREFRTVAFVPEDREIVSGSSGFRRRFFDMLISSVDAGYLKSLSDYNRALAQRNKALKSDNPEAARYFNSELAERTPEIIRSRAKYSEHIASEVDRMAGGKHTFRIRYICDSSEDPEQNLRLLERNFQRDKLRKVTASGPQLDDFEFYLDEKLMRNYSSTGQRGIVSLLLKLAEFNTVRSESSVPLIALVDDVTNDLDRDNVELFLSTIQSADQRFFTFTEVPGSGIYKNFKQIAMDEGTVS